MRGSKKMDAVQLSKRLQLVANFVPQKARLADIGSDHAYLPVHLALNGQIEKAIAGEVAKGPFQNASHEIKARKLTNIIEPRLADGLAAIELTDRIDTITIAGMGGTLITEILDQGQAKLSGVKTLILQPNVGEDGLRRWLMEHQYQIIAEKILSEDQQIYEIMVVQPSSQPVTYSEQELQYGPILLQNRTPIFMEKWQQEKQHLEQAVVQMKQAKQLPVKRIAAFEQKINSIEKVLR